MLIEIFRFTLTPGATIAASGFGALRRAVTAAGARTQHFGYSVAVTTAPIAKRRHEITWAIGTNRLIQGCNLSLANTICRVEVEAGMAV